MHEDFDPSDIVEDLKQRIAALRKQTIVLKGRLSEVDYEELQISLVSVEFFLNRLALAEANEELLRAISIAENRK